MRNCSHKVSATLSLVVIASVAVASGASKNQGETELRVEKKTLQPGVRYEFSKGLPAGRLVKQSNGVPGTSESTYRLIYRNGNVSGKELLLEKRIEAQPAIYVMGQGSFHSSRGSYVRAQVLDVVATAYDPGAECNGGHAGQTRTGLPAAFGIIAVDPRVIPLRSLVYVEGYGMAIAGDTGGAIKGMRIDLCYNSRAEANRFGRQKVKIHVMRSR